jgi:DNA (cytosine-5)-methyltransferase 1
VACRQGRFDVVPDQSDEVQSNSRTGVNGGDSTATPADGDAKMKVLDLFCGAGGMAIGFAKAGFSVSGVDINPWARKIFARNHIGMAIIEDLKSESIRGEFPVVTGGPPCRPWSRLNTGKRGVEHPDHPLLGRFFEHVSDIEPVVFVLENVEALARDHVFRDWIEKLRCSAYSVAVRNIAYSDFGAPTARRRLITVGVRRGGRSAEWLFDRLKQAECQSASVGDAIRRFEGLEYGGFADHVWSKLTTIDKYEKYYQTGKYGWYQLEYDAPAPSFGNIAKTYILHPASGDRIAPRVISVREALAIIGFDDGFSFPPEMGTTLRYQMVADAVSPAFSEACAEVVMRLLRDRVEG